MNFNNDNSTQLNIGSATFTPSYSSKTAPNLISNDSSSGIYNPSLNTIKFFTNNIDAFTAFIHYSALNQISAGRTKQQR